MENLKSGGLEGHWEFGLVVPGSIYLSKKETSFDRALGVCRLPRITRSIFLNIDALDLSEAMVVIQFSRWIQT